MARLAHSRPTEFTSAVSRPSPPRSATRPGARSTCSPTSTTTGVTAAEVAEQFALHPNVARHHLDKLAAGGYLEVAVGRGRARGAGRPSKRYRASPNGSTLDVPVRHDDLLVTLLGRALALLPHDQAEAMAEEVGVEYGRAMAAARRRRQPTASARSAPRCTPSPTRSPRTASPPTPRSAATQLRIVTDHCPFGDAAIEHPVICAVDRGMVKGMLGALYGDTDHRDQVVAARGRRRLRHRRRGLTAGASGPQPGATPRSTGRRRALP